MNQEVLQAVFMQMRDNIKSSDFAAKVISSRGIPSLEVKTREKTGSSKLVLSVDVLTDADGKTIKSWRSKLYDPQLAAAPLDTVRTYAAESHIDLRM